MYISPFESFYIIYYLYSSFFIVSNLSIFLITIVIYIYILFLILKYTSYFWSFNPFKQYLKRTYELSYNFINEQLPIEGKKYMKYMEYLFFIILFSNILGFFPYSVALTSQISFIFVISLTSFLAMQYIAIERFSATAFRFFLPPGIPTVLSIFIVNIELISYVFRVISLSVRILANIVAGHLLCKIIGIFVYIIYNESANLFFIISIFPAVIIFALCFLELFVCFLQAYVFVILCCMYLRDVLTIYLH